MAATTSAEENKELVRDYLEAVEEREFDALDEFLASDYTLYGIPGTETDLTGVDAIESYFREMLEAFPDMTMTLEELVAEDDKVAYRGHLTATHEGEFMGLTATGKQVNVDSTGFFKIEDGKLAAGRPQMDRFGMMQQLGVIEAPGE